MSVNDLPISGAFARFAATLAPDDRLKLLIAAGEEALKALHGNARVEDASGALDLARGMIAGRVSPDTLEDALQNEADEGILINEQEARSPVEKAAWLALASILAYTARVGFQKIDELPGPLVGEVREDEISNLEGQLRRIDSVDWHRLRRRDIS